jgi:hypothetical protein
MDQTRSTIGVFFYAKPSEELCAKLRCLTQASVGDPDPQDPHVFGPPGSDPLVRGMDPDLAPDPSLFS